MKKYLFMLCAAATVVNAAEYFCSPSGNDAASGSRTAPWKTPAKAVNRVKKGDIITLLPGTYSGGIKMNVSGVTLRGTRGKDGEFLSCIAGGEVVKNWQQESAIADNLWSAPWKEQAGCVTLNDKQIILLGKRLMALAPRQLKPKVLIGSHYAFGRGNRRARTKNMIPGLDLLALPDGTHIQSGQFGKKSLDLWKYANYVMAGWRNGKLYLRLLNGKTPADYTIRCGGTQPGVIITDRRDIVISDLHIKAVRVGISINGKQAVKNCVRNCKIENGIARVAVGNGAAETHIHDNIMTLGMINSRNHSSRDWQANRFTYVAFKYLVSNRQVSDDHALNFDGAGAGNLVENNIVYQGLNGTSTALCKGITIRNNIFREMSSCGIVCARGSIADVYGNVLIENGISLRFHWFHGTPEKRLNRVYDNIFIQRNSGMQLFFHCMKNFMNSDEKVWIYHNTIAGCTYFVSARKFQQAYKGHVRDVYMLNNLVLDAPGAGFPLFRAAAGNALPPDWHNKKLWGKNNFTWQKLSGTLPFVTLASAAPGSAEKILRLDRENTVDGVNIPPLPGMKGHPTLPGAAIRNKSIVELVKKSDELSAQAIARTRGIISK